ncbi:hypothetical protein [Pseudomonas fitomaticsae]|uniref:Uncharacterized protein n=1 Tax=Pseudomonas fitomaticsae TaxID=2837969 RepID=A0ABY3Q7U3_9PSED|nr:hypothetical protein [Pseudomonas fitomaticsae]UFQ02230.1 hypothetical protein KJY40_11255 [Pseudomonas fitomaticsae]
MMDLTVASFLAALTVGYWALCRFRSVGLRERASEVVTEFIERDDTSENDATSAYGAYFLATKWWFLPVSVIFSIVLIPYIALFDKSGPDAKHSDKRKVMASCMLFHIARNPLISVVCLSLLFVWTTLFVVIGILTRRLTSVPTFDHVLDVVSTLRPERNRHAH